MAKLHIANTNFEWELGETKTPALDKALERNQIYLQLQFLPFLYADAKDGVYVTNEPEKEFWQQLDSLKINPPKLHLLKDNEKLPYTQIDSWGASRSVLLKAGEREIPYSIPSWDVVSKVNSKEFSFQCSPKLPNAALIYSPEEFQSWFSSLKSAAVLKTCFGVSGKGHLHIDPQVPINLPKIEQYLSKEWKMQRPVIAEPWVTRLLDFSTQWEIHPKGKIEYIGATICENDAKGGYVTNRVGDVPAYFGLYFHYLDEHLAVAKQVLKKMAQMGYYGNVGIDAMLYQLNTIPCKILLHPIVEINARKTMGWVALQLHQKHFSKHQKMALHYINSDIEQKSLLPRTLKQKGDTLIKFSKQLLVEAI